MDIPAAYTGLKYAIATLRTAVTIKTKIEANQKIADALDHLGRVQDTLFELRDRLAELQAENLALKAQLVPKNDWEVESAKYGIVTTKGGATVYRTKEPPMRYACPKCYADQKIQFLQDLRVMSGDYRCPSCKVAYSVDGHQEPPPLKYPGGSGSGGRPHGWMRR